MDFVELDRQLESVGTLQCRQWSAHIFARHPALSGYLKSHYIRLNRQFGHVVANKNLRALDERLLWQGITAAQDHSEIKRFSRMYAGIAERLFKQAYSKTKSVSHAVSSVCTYVRKFEVESPLPDNWKQLPDKDLVVEIKKAFSDRWWRRKIRTLLNQRIETVLREIAFVRVQKSAYISKFSLAKFRQQRNRNNLIIDDLVAISNLGESIPLREAIDASISNPENRYSELMVRMRGFEDLAVENKLTGLFLTMSCPSRFHAYLKKSGRKNPKFDGSTTTDAKNYLNTIWRQIRAAYDKAGIKDFGFRICEPHHDGTPHFHFVLFFDPAKVNQAMEIFRAHNLKVDGDEPGAKDKRTDIQVLDLINGSATGYIAKYISKNIDGMHIDEDHESKTEGSTGALQVRAWASLWNIRQFQQIGGPSVTVYRELRRNRSPLSKTLPNEAETARKSADEGNFAEFTKAMGGIFTPRKNLLLRAMHIVKEKASIYGGDIKKIIGVVTLAGQPIRTRDKEWTIMPSWMLVTQKAAQPPSLEFCQ